MNNKCPKGKILNPKTGRCVNKDGKIGQEILKNKKDDKVKKDGKPKKECKSYQIPNPKTGRCVNKDGKLGQEILLRDGKIATPVGPGIPDNFKKLPDDCELNKVWKTKSKIGRGEYGTAYITCKDDDDCNYVLKVQDLTNDFYTEVSCLEDLKNTKNIVPKIYAAWTCDNNGYFVIEKLDKCPYDKFNRDKDTYKEVSNLLKKLKEKGWLHVDTHYRNIMCKNGKFILIDFGWAVKKGQKTYPDNPLSIKLGEPLTFRDLELAQEKNKEDFFGYSKYKIRMASRNWDNRKLD